ncbi:MAG: sugar ABC transporter permease [Bacillales bacterium]|nr:sugar ABC transporter permease [Bacillales bacterium]
MTKIKYKSDQVKTAIIALLPSFVLLTTFAIIPIFLSLSSSTLEGNNYMGFKFVGFSNYLKVLTDSNFWKSFLVGFQYVLVIVPIQLVLAFFLASLIIKLKQPLQSIIKVCIYVPCILSGIVVGAIFMYLYEYDAGLINTLLKIFNVDKVAWLADPKTALVAVGIASIWAGLGYVTLVMLGGLLDIPKDYYEAASLDGANIWQKFWHVTLPGIKNVGAYLLISCFVSTFQIFELPFIMTGGGPLDSTMGPIGYIYQHFSYDTTLGFTYASSVLIALFLAVASSLVFKLVNSSRSQE